MKKISRTLAILIIAALSVMVIAACGKTPEPPAPPAITAGSFASADVNNGGTIYRTMLQLHTDGTYYMDDFATITVGGYEVKDENVTYTDSENVSHTAAKKITFDGVKTYPLDLVDNVYVIIDFPCCGAMWEENLVQNPSKSYTETAVTMVEYFDSSATDGASIELLTDYSFIYWEKGMMIEDDPFEGTWSKVVTASGKITYTLTGKAGTGANVTFTLVVDGGVITMTYSGKTINLQTLNPAEAKDIYLKMEGTKDGWATATAYFFKDLTFVVNADLLGNKIPGDAEGTYVINTDFSLTLTYTKHPKNETSGTVTINTVGEETTYSMTYNSAYQDGIELVNVEVGDDENPGGEPTDPGGEPTDPGDEEAELVLTLEDSAGMFPCFAYFYDDGSFEIKIEFVTGTATVWAHGTYTANTTTGSFELVFSDESTATATADPSGYPVIEYTMVYKCEIPQVGQQTFTLVGAIGEVE